MNSRYTRISHATYRSTKWCVARASRPSRNDVEVFEARPRAAPAQARLRDPACGLELTPAEVAARLTLGGTDYAFCSEACVHTFVARRDARQT